MRPCWATISTRTSPSAGRCCSTGFTFFFTCKPSSHPHLSGWVEGLEPGRGRHTLKQRVKGKSNRWEHHQYRWANGVPLTDSEDALKVNWCELTITDAQGQVLYRNSFITDWKINAENVEGLVAAGRARWKIENENNNVLKTKGYHLEHNFGHGKKHLASLLMTMNLLAFGLHTLLELADQSYRLIRSGGGTAAEVLSTPGSPDHLSAFRDVGAADEFHDAGPGDWPLRCSKKLNRHGRRKTRHQRVRAARPLVLPASLTIQSPPTISSWATGLFTPLHSGHSENCWVSPA